MGSNCKMKTLRGLGLLGLRVIIGFGCKFFDEVDIGGFGRALLRQSLHCDVVLTALHCTSVAFMGALLISKTVLIDTPSMSKGIVVVGATQPDLTNRTHGAPF